MDDITQHSNKRLATILRDPSHPMHSAAKAERDRRMAKREDNDLDEINLKDLSKKIAQSSGNKNLNKAMKKSKDKTVSDLAAMRKRLDALKAGYAAESTVNELSNKTLTRFAMSAYNDVQKRRSNRPAGKGDESDPKIGKRLDKINLAHKKGAFKEEVELDEAKQVLAHGGKGQYKIVSDGGAISVMFKGKVVGKGDFDRGANSFFVSMKGQKGQKSFDDAQDIADYFAKMKIKEEVQIDEVLDTPKAMQSYLNKNKASADRAASSAAAKILRGKDKDGNRADHSPEVKTRDKRAKGAELANRNATRKTFNRLRNEMTEGGMKRIATTQSNKAERMASGGKKGLETFKKKPADSRLDKNLKKLKNMRKADKSWAKSSAFDFVDEASKEGTIRIIDLGRMGKGKGFQVQRMTKGKFVDQGKPYKSQKDAEKVRKDGQHSMQFEAAPKVDPVKFAAHMARHDKPKKMTSTQKSLADIRKKSVNEKYKLHHKTMTAALQHAYDEVKKKGYEIDKDDIDNKVAFGPKKPSSGKTNSYSLGLSKNGKPVKQKLHIQVYNMDNKSYELNMYVS